MSLSKPKVFFGKMNIPSYNQNAEMLKYFSCLPLAPWQCQQLRNEHHIYLPDNGRINISGLNSSNIGRVASAIVAVMQDSNQAHL